MSLYTLTQGALPVEVQEFLQGKPAMPEESFIASGTLEGQDLRREIRRKPASWSDRLIRLLRVEVADTVGENDEDGIARTH